MKKFFALFILASFITGMTQAQSTKTASVKLLRHVVLFKFKEGTTDADIHKVEEAFRALPDIIKDVKGFEWGTNNSPEKINDGYTHCFLVSFSSEKARDAYLPHPAHKAFVALLKPYLEKALVVDYWATH